jgi:chemotaxis response regulator CheB
MAKTVSIVDDNASVRRALRELFKREMDIAVCGEAENGRLASEEAGRWHPDLIVLDLLDARDERSGCRPPPSGA